MRFWISGFFLQAHGTPVFIKLDYTIAFRVAYLVGKDRGAFFTISRSSQRPIEFMTMEDVISQNQRATVGTDKLGTDQEGLRQPVGDACTA